MLMKINLSSCGSTNHPNCVSLPPAKHWKRIKAEREVKLCVLNCALIFAEQKSPRSYPIRGPQQPEGDVDTSGAWKLELLEGEADCSWKGCRKVRNWKLGRGWQFSPSFWSVDQPPLTDAPFFACLFSPHSAQEHLRELSPFPLLHLEVKSHLML